VRLLSAAQGEHQGDLVPGQAVVMDWWIAILPAVFIVALIGIVILQAGELRRRDELIWKLMEKIRKHNAP
jgi:low affinity Fe/Cu permease